MPTFQAPRNSHLTRQGGQAHPKCLARGTWWQGGGGRSRRSAERRSDRTICAANHRGGSQKGHPENLGRWEGDSDIFLEKMDGWMEDNFIDTVFGINM